MRTLGVALACLTISGTAFAQNESTYAYDGPFVPLAELPCTTPIQSIAFSDADDDFVANLPIGFRAYFFGDTLGLTNFGVSTNGWMGFLPNSPAANVNAPLPNPAGNVPPNGMVAAWWDDLNLASAGLSGIYAIVGTAPNRALVIQVDNFARAPGLNDGGRWQVWVYESAGPGDIRVDVRVDGELSGVYNASTGYESVFGNPNGGFLPCAASASCTAVDFASMVGRVFTVIDSANADLVLSLGDVPGGPEANGSASVPVTVTNIGAVTAQNVLVQAFLSTDNKLDIADTMVGQTTIAAIAPAGASMTTNIDLTTSGVQTGSYRLIVRVDPNDTAQQAFTVDDTNVHQAPFITGADLEPVEVSAPPFPRPNGDIETDVTVAQRGRRLASGTARISVYASSNRAFDPGVDVPIGTADITLDGSPQFMRTVVGRPQSNLPPGDYYAIAVIDEPGAIAEVNEVNNRLTSATRFAVGPDFQFGRLQGPSNASPGASVPVTVDVSSRGVPFAGGVAIDLFASETNMLDPMNAIPLGRTTANFAGTSDEMLTVPGTATFPANTPPGSFFICAQVDATRAHTETDETNNMGCSQSQTLTASDLLVRNVNVTPNRGTPGSMINVTAEVEAFGTPIGSPVLYSAYLSADAQFDMGDTLVPLASGQMQGMLTLTNNVGAVDQTFRLPDTTIVRQWRVILVVDPTNVISEANESNNAAAALTFLAVEGAELVIDTLSGPPFGFIGRNYPLRGLIRNAGVATAADFRVAVYLSENPLIVTSDIQLARSGDITLGAGETRALEDIFTAVPIPMNLMPASERYLGVIVDVTSAVPESNELNNVLSLAGTIAIAPASPDLTGRIFSAPATAAPGETISVQRLLQNTGVLDAPTFNYGYYLSADDMITTDDTLVGTLQGSVAQGAEAFGNDDVRVPQTVPPGDYRLGLILDPLGELPETDEMNNQVLGPAITVAQPGLRFVNAALPQATLGVAYEIGIFAVGSPVPSSVSISDGALPDGLRLDGNTGFISGTPETEGLFQFTARATAQSAVLERTFSLRVAPPTILLNITTEAIPAALTQRDYRYTVQAVGGIGDYTWSISSTTALPQGYTFSSDGVLAGNTPQPGRFDLPISVEDEVGDRISKTLVFYAINARQSVAIRQVDLPDGVVDEVYGSNMSAGLRAERGIEPYRWSVDGDFVPGLDLSEDGFITGTPNQAGTFSVVVRVTDATGLSDTSQLFLTVLDVNNLAVSTFVLPDATVGQAYEAQVSAIRGQAPYSFTLESGALPPSFMLAADGKITGTATSTGTHSFIVRVTDARAATRDQALSIAVVDPVVEEGGCSCSTSRSGARSSVLWLVALMLVVRRRRS